ncbi:hypothetical protein C0Q70_16972 [Pomacea canaliculata]|uniref:Uncharacterized protein n=1 Tax=Pomacea canaliculata TaxID=400727 RepID=A0A2T7NR99_POMCA|nr:hypothetical protein C0Q70_16972 [Pomacea canaliculata]
MIWTEQPLSSDGYPREKSGPMVVACSLLLLQRHQCDIIIVQGRSNYVNPQRLVEAQRKLRRKATTKMMKRVKAGLWMMNSFNKSETNVKRRVECKRRQSVVMAPGEPRHWRSRRMERANMQCLNKSSKPRWTNYMSYTTCREDYVGFTPTRRDE